MKHLKTFMALVAVLLGFAWMSAETVENYSLDFNTSISTSDHAFKVAPGWKHIVGGEEDWWGDITYVTYTYMANAGVEGTGALGIGAQSGTSTDNYDYLVTPVITGSVTMQVQLTASSNSTGIKIYAINEADDGTLTVGDVLANETVAMSTSLTQENYGAVTVNGLNGQRIGIVGYNINLDDFVVNGSAEIEYEKALTITSVVSSVTGSGSVNCDTDNNFSFTYTITVKNTGECALAADDENMYVGITDYKTHDTPIVTAPIGQAMEIGDEVTVELTANLNYADYPNRTRYDAIEGISGTFYVVTPWIEPIPYLPNIIVRDADGHNLVEYPSYASLFGAFGMINAPTSKIMQVRNSGAAPGEITITVPEGFTAEPATFTAEPNTNTNVTITMGTNQIGIISGNLVVTCGTDEIATIALSGTVLDTSKWFVNFEDQTIPGGCIIENNSWYVNTNSMTISDDNTRYLCSQSRNLNKFITPLLKVEDGEKMTVDVGRLTGTNADDILLNIYYSADRENWTLITTVLSNELPTTTNSGYNRAFLPKNVVLEGIPAGNVYIAFEAGYVYIDNIYGFELVDVDHDLMITSTTIPSQAMANNDLTAKATLKNINVDAEGADYTATLYFNNEAVATANAQEIAAGGTAEFEFTFVPNEVGTFPAYVEFVCEDGYTVSSDEVEVTISAENAENVYIVGNTDPNAEGWYISTYSYAVPICNYYRNGWSEALYTPTMLENAGLNVGDVITSFTYMGYNPGVITDAVKVYVITTEDVTMKPFTKTDVTDLTPVFDDNYTFEVAGTADSPVDLLKITLPEPITWDGSSIRIVVASDRVSGSDTRTCFLTDSKIGGECYQGRSDSQSSSAVSLSESSYFPVTKFGVQLNPATYSGIVTDIDDNPIEGATVILKSRTEGRGATSGPAVYTATTDADGKFSVEVVQVDKIYDATFSADGYNDETIENINLANGNVVLEEPVILTPSTYTGLESLGAKSQISSVKYYNVAGSMSDRPFDGVNIVVTTYTDGTTSTTKIVK